MKSKVKHRKPHRINAEYTRILEDMYETFPSPHLPFNVTVYAVDQNKGMAYEKRNVITVPVWAFTRPKGKGYALYYLAHELAHIVDYRNGTQDKRRPHGPSFMHEFKKLCPIELQHFELDYKPRNAATAGIRKRS